MNYSAGVKSLLIVILGLFTSFTYASDTSTKAAHIASPEIYQVLLENEEVLVLQMVLKPGQSDNWHKHNAETVYFERGGKVVIKSLSSKMMELDIPDGHVMWHDQWQHQVSNIGNSSITAIIVERKKQ